MRRLLLSGYRFLPVQLLLLHFRKYQLLLIFWFVLFATISGHFAKSFGADALFLAPEYFGRISFSAMTILGLTSGVFVMSWHITTFIIHSKRMPFIGATRHSFLNYCINNSLLPLAFLIAFSVLAIRYQRAEEVFEWGEIIALQAGFYLGFHLALFFSFFYFFRVGRDLLKQVVATITNAAQLKNVIPYDSLDEEFYMVRADTYISATFRVRHVSALEKYHLRVLSTVLRRHHRNAVFATVMSLVVLMLIGSFMEQPALRIPAGAGFMLLFSVMVGILGAVKYFLRSWELLGWIALAGLLSWMAGHGAMDLRSVATGIHYPISDTARPEYSYTHLLELTDTGRMKRDYDAGIQQLNNWKVRRAGARRPLVVVMVSGGGLRAAYWSFHCLRVADSLSGGLLARSTALVTGASGGMIGACWWRTMLEDDLRMEGSGAQPYYMDAGNDSLVAQDLLNPVIFSMATSDFISPFNRVRIDGRSYRRDRGHALERELGEHSGGRLSRSIGYYRSAEQLGILPQYVLHATIINDGRKLLFGAQPLSYLCRPAHAIHNPRPAVDAVDFGSFFSGVGGNSLKLSSALRMNATFPYILPVVKLPSHPEINVMDAGLRDNFGAENCSRWLYTFRDWLLENTSEVIVLQIRDTREFEVFPLTEQKTLGAMVADPATVIATKWEPFQSYTQGYIQDFIPGFLPGHVRFVTLQYEPTIKDKTAALNFHLTNREKTDIRAATLLPQNRAALDSLQAALRQSGF